MVCRFSSFFSFHFAPFKLDAGITKLCAVHSLCMLQRFDLYTITKRYIKIWKKNKQCNAVSWLLTPFLDCTYDEKSYLFACSRATIIFFKPLHKKDFQKENIRRKQKYREKKEPFHDMKGIFHKNINQICEFLLHSNWFDVYLQCSNRFLFTIFKSFAHFCLFCAIVSFAIHMIFPSLHSPIGNANAIIFVIIISNCFIYSIIL